MDTGDDVALQVNDDNFAAGVCLLIFLVWALLAFLPGLVLGILISLAWDGGISRATVGVVTVVTGVLLHVVLILGSIRTRSIDKAAAERLAQDPGTDYHEATIETMKRDFPHLEFTDDGNAYHHIWANHLNAGSGFLSELRHFGVDAELTRCWSPDPYSLACQITTSGQLTASIVFGDWDGVYETEFFISDPRIQASTRQINLRAVRSKTFPVFGQVRKVVWKGSISALDSPTA